MTQYKDVIIAYSIMLILILAVGIFQSWNIAISILNFCLISAVMTMGANIQWGYAGLINFGIMGYTALGGLAAVLISVDPIQEAWRAGQLVHAVSRRAARDDAQARVNRSQVPRDSHAGYRGLGRARRLGVGCQSPLRRHADLQETDLRDAL